MDGSMNQAGRSPARFKYGRTTVRRIACRTYSVSSTGLRVTAAASFYGTWLVSDAEESPHLSLDKVKGELYIACAEYDNLAPLPMVEELRTLFGRAGTPGEIEIYPGVNHGFAFPQRWCYDKPAAERHWERLIALYRRRLG